MSFRTGLLDQYDRIHNKVVLEESSSKKPHFLIMNERKQEEEIKKSGMDTGGSLVEKSKLAPLEPSFGAGTKP